MDVGSRRNRTEPGDGPGFEPHHTHWFAIAGPMVAASVVGLAAVMTAFGLPIPPWLRPWLWVALIGSALFGLAGGYLWVAPFTGWHVPVPRADTRRRWQLAVLAIIFVITLMCIVAYHQAVHAGTSA